MPEAEIRNLKSEFRKKPQAHRSADFPVALLVRLRRFWHACAQTATRGGIRFQKYRVAPRLSTDIVRRRLLLGLQARATLAATETGMA